jgi:thiamine-phosphate pyrophosphorylase
MLQVKKGRKLMVYLRKYFIMGSQDCSGDPVETLKKAIDAGITAFQFREKGPGALTGDDKVTLGKKLRRLCKQHHVPFFINNDVHLIEELEVDGIHVGQNDVSPIQLRDRYPHLQIGLSISNSDELQKSPLDKIDYIGAGAVFKTKSKADAQQAVGLGWIETLHALFPNISIVGIGGINTENAGSVLDAGAAGVAVITVITKASDIQKAVAKL